MNQKEFSRWMRIDLHIHTDLSRTTKENDYKGLFSVDVLKTKIIENRVEIFSLTDHNIINVNAYEEYYKEWNSNLPLLLLGVELDIEVEFNGAKRTYHSIITFNITEIDGVRRIHQSLEQAYVAKGITDPKERVLTIDEIVKYFSNEEFFFIPHAGNTKSIVDAHKGTIESAQRMVLLMESAFEKVPEKAKQKYNDGFNRVLAENFKGKDDLAYIDFSDNHNINKYPCLNKGDDGVDHVFCYIKGGKNFETLRLAFIDPCSRIKSNSEYMEILNNRNNYIEAINIPNARQMDNSHIWFSPHLNVIIGGRSSGKSLLMNILGQKYGAIGNDGFNNYNSVADIGSIKIKTNLDVEFKDSAATNQNYIYINQGDIVGYFEGRNLGQLAQKSGKTNEYQQAISKIKSHKADLSNSIENWIKAYEDIHKENRYEFVIYGKSISNMLSEEFVFMFDYEAIYEKYVILESLNNSGELLNTLSLHVENVANDNNLEISESDRNLINSFNTFIAEKQILINGKRSATLKRETFINSMNDLIAQFNEGQSQGAKDKQFARTAVNEVLKKMIAKLAQLKELKNKSEILEKYNYSKVESFSLNDDINFAIETDDGGSVKAQILDGINGSKVNESIYLNSLSLLNLRSTVKIHKTNLPSDLRKKTTSQIQSIMESIDKPKDYLDYKTGETSKNKSPGFNSEMYLKVVLNYPKIETIFIDQPEDNLGNRFIAEDLVNVIRSVKFKKQVFLVTHNPSIVVYGDAENIIISENKGNVISYTQVVLEDKTAQKSICQILDGGEYVFNNRSRKYNIKRLLKEEN